MIRIPITIAGIRVREFLDYLRLQLDFEDFWRSEGSFQADGRFIETVTGRLKGIAGESGQLTFMMNWNLDGTLADITAEAEEGAPHDWQARVQEWIRNALFETINARRKRHFSNHTFAYLGPVLDGEYYIAGFRLAPAVFPDFIDELAESVVYLGLHAEGVDHMQARLLGQIQAERFASLLSCFLHVGLYTIPIERRWVLTGRNQSARHQLGFVPKDPPPTEMPVKGRLCRLGTFMPVDRTQLLVPAWGPGTLKQPADIRKLFRSYACLASDE